MNEIYDLIEKLGGEIVIDRTIVCKMSPHTPPEKLKGIITKETDFTIFSNYMIGTILQRFKLLYYEKFNEIYSYKN